VETLVVAWAWGRYLGAEALEQGVDVCVSTWTRPAPNTHPTLAKAGGNYINSCLMKMEALENGYADAIALGAGGTVSEGSGQNLFLVRDGVLRTPALDGTMLAGVTRDSVIRLARRLEIPVEEGIVPRETLYTADELFFTGTASELTPIRSVDRIPVGSGRPGPVTRRLQEEYLAVVRGEREDVFGWLDRVEGMAAAAAG
jgi:branched-chain amino acid aminotransferase